MPEQEQEPHDEPSQPEVPSGAPPEAPPQLSLWDHLRRNRVFVIASLVSALLHLTAVLTTVALSVTLEPVKLELDQSAGVALLAQMRERSAELAPPPPPKEPEKPVEAEVAAADTSPEPDAEAPDASPEPDTAPPEEPKPEEPKPEEPKPDEPKPEEPKPEEPKPEEPKPEEPKPEEPKPEPRPQPPQPPPSPVTAPDGSGQHPSEGSAYPEGTLHPVATDVGMWGPDSAVFTMITRNDRIRASEHLETTRKLLGSLPDWQALVGRSSLDPFKDTDAILIASSDPRWVNQTFLAVVHQMVPEQVVRVLTAARGGRVQWTENRGRLFGTPAIRPGVNDPRVYLIPVDGLFIYTRPENVEPLLDGAPPSWRVHGALERMRRAEGSGEGSGAGAEGRRAPRRVVPTRRPGPGRGAAQGSGEGSGAAVPVPLRPVVKPPPSLVPGGLAGRPVAPRPVPAPARPRLGETAPDDKPPIRSEGWIQGLLEIADFGGPGPDGPAIDLTARVRSLRLPGMRQSVAPQVIHATVTATHDPIVQGRMVFENAAQAATFIAEWPRIVAAVRNMIESNPLVAMVASPFVPPLNATTWRQEGSEAIFRLVLPKRLLDQAADTLPALMGSRAGDP